MLVHTMTSVTIKDIPDELMERLRRRAAKDHRSLNKEAIHLLEAALSGLVPTDDAAHRKAAVEQQAEAWSRLAGHWESDRTVEEEIGEIYASRTEGRESSL
jgi:plasmid stability protein